LQLPLALPLLSAGERLPASLQQLLPPAVIKRLGDLVLSAELLHRHIAPQPGQHDLKPLLRRERPVPPLPAQPDLPSLERPILRAPPDDEPQPGTRLPRTGVQGSTASRQPVAPERSARVGVGVDAKMARSRHVTNPAGVVVLPSEVIGNTGPLLDGRCESREY